LPALLARCGRREKARLLRYRRVVRRAGFILIVNSFYIESSLLAPAVQLLNDSNLGARRRGAK